MSSMYELMLQLPIFQGISKDQLTEIVEKTPFHFDKYRAGDVIQQGGETCERVIFLLSGEVRLFTPTFGGRITIVQDFNAPQTMPFHHFFGVDTHSRSTLVALDAVGIMSIDKPHFLDVVSRNKILLVAVLNILSTQAQKQFRVLDFYAERDPMLRMASWIYLSTMRPSHHTFFDATITDWCQMLQMDQATFWRCVAQLEEGKCVEVVSGKLQLSDRYALRQLIASRLEEREDSV